MRNVYGMNCLVLTNCWIDVFTQIRKKKQNAQNIKLERLTNKKNLIANPLINLMPI